MSIKRHDVKPLPLPAHKARSRVAVSPHSEWTNHHGALELFGLRRTFLYWLAKEALIESVALTHSGQKRGVRLFNVASIRAFINARLKEGTE